MRKFDRNGDGALAEPEFLELVRWTLWRKYEDLNPPKFRRGDVIGGAHRGVPCQYYHIGKQLGAGQFGIVHLISHRRTGIECVMKTVNKDKAVQGGTPVALLSQEIDLLAMLDHPHMLRLFEWYNDHHNIYIIMDACAGGELLDLVLETRDGQWRLPEAWIARIFGQALQAIGYCHAKGVMHKDLKFENVMLQKKLTSRSSVDDVHTVVIDVGLAELFGPQHAKQSRSSVRAGSLATMAPEVLAGDFSYKCDIWSLGCMLFAIFNTRPFNIPDGQGGEVLYMYPFFPQPAQGDAFGLEALQAAQLRGPPMAQVAPAGPRAQELMVRMLQCDERLRADARECLAAPWLAQGPDGHGASEAGLSPDLAGALLQEREHRHWWRATVVQAASHLPGAKIEPLAELFERMDQNRDGTLARPELAMALQRLGVGREQAERAAEAADFDGNGQIEWSEFVASCLPASRELFAVSLQIAFQQFDLNQDGTLDPGEVLELLRGGHIGEAHMPASKTAETMVQELDRDSNGRISFREFHEYFMQADVASQGL